jgi:hypothetical protein
MSIFAIALLFFQTQLATASGVVTKPGSNEPLPGATVILSLATANPTGRAASQTSRIPFTTTEDDGRFTIRDIEPGEYRLQVQSPLYGGAAYGQRRPDGPGTILRIGPGQRLSDLKVAMVPTGTIAGRVTGRNGEPLAYATVQALKSTYQDGKRIPAVVQTTTTDDRGEYRLFWLTSGKYIVVAGALTGLAASPAATSPPTRPGEPTRTTGDLLFGPGIPGLPGLNQTGALLEGTNLVKRILEDGTVREESWMPTYYPATTDRGQATPVDVTAGSTVTGISIALGPSTVQTIRGRVIGGSNMTVSLASAGQGTTGRWVTKEVSPIDDSFEFPGVVPGPYYVTARDRAGLVSTPAAVLVGDRDVENLSIALAPAIAVSVRVAVEGATVPADLFTALSGTLRSELDTSQRAAFSILGPVNVQLKPGNAMALANVPPGDYQFNINQPALVWENLKRVYIKSMRFGREDALGTIHVTSDMKDVLLDVVLTTETGSVEGLAISRTGNSAANVTVALVPANARKRTALYQTVVTGSDGKFRFPEIPPGDYKLFAWDDIETGAWQDADFIRPYESRGRAVRVSEASKEEVQLNVIYNP